MLTDRTDVDPDAGIPDLVRQLGEDSRRLVSGEVRLAKLEMRDSLQRAGRGAVWLAVAFGMGVITLVALTIFVATLIGWLAARHMWIGALVTGAIELIVAFVLVKRGAAAFAEPSYSLEETRESLKDTAAWVRSPRG